MITASDSKSAIDGFDLVQSVTVGIANFYKKKGYLLDDNKIFSEVSRLLKQRIVIVEGKVSQAYPNYKYHIVGEKGKDEPFSFHDIVKPDQDAIDKFYATFALITPLKQEDWSRLENALKMQKALVLRAL